MGSKITKNSEKNDKVIRGTGSAAFLLLLLASNADAAQICIHENGYTYTYDCTNSCVVTENPDGSISVRDCCGGRVYMLKYPYYIPCTGV